MTDQKLAAIDSDVLREALKKFMKPESITMCMGQGGLRLSGEITQTTTEEIPDPPFERKTKEQKVIEENIPREALIHLSDFEPGRVNCCEILGSVLKDAVKKKREVSDNYIITWDDKDKSMVLEQKSDAWQARDKFGEVTRKFKFLCNNFDRELPEEDKQVEVIYTTKGGYTPGHEPK